MKYVFLSVLPEFPFFFPSVFLPFSFSPSLLFFFLVFFFFLRFCILRHSTIFATIILDLI